MTSAVTTTDATGTSRALSTFTMRDLTPSTMIDTVLSILMPSPRRMARRTERQRDRDIAELTETLRTMNSRQLSALGLSHFGLEEDVSSRYDSARQQVDDLLAIIDGRDTVVTGA